MPDAFLQRYLDAFERIEGWFSPDAALMFMAYYEVATSHGICGDVLEIGVHHGLSTIALAAMRCPGAAVVAIDLFDDLQDQNVSASGSGSRSHFERNLSHFFDETDFIRCIAAASDTLRPEDLGARFSFCHVDGGHSATETYQDLDLCSHVLIPGGLLALDDYFNPGYPGVCEGAIRFWLDHPGTLAPVAIGFNKVLFQKQPASFDVNEAFAQRFPGIVHQTATFWETRAHAFSSFSSFIDIAASTPTQLVENSSFRVDARLTPETLAIAAPLGGDVILLPVRVRNQSSIPFGADASGAPFALSYHLLTKGGSDLRFDNARSYFRPQLPPDEERTMDLAVEVPAAPGEYHLEIDIVWEGITWLKTRGVVTPRVLMTVG